MAQLLSLLSMAASLGALVCFIMVVVQTFQHGRTGAGVGLIISFFVCCIGIFVGLIYGWTKADAWRIKNLMIVYTVCVLTNIGISIVNGPAQYQMIMDQMKLQQQQLQQQQQPGGGAPPPVVVPEAK